jgi:hypothetical protein
VEADGASPRGNGTAETDAGPGTRPDALTKVSDDPVNGIDVSGQTRLERFHELKPSEARRVGLVPGPPERHDLDQRFGLR